MDFQRVILADELASAFIGQSSLDDFATYVRNPECDTLVATFRRSRSREESLRLLVLFDKVIIPDPGIGLRLRKLEDAGIVEVASMDFSHAQRRQAAAAQAVNRAAQARGRRFIKSGEGPTFLDNRMVGNIASFTSACVLVQHYKPLIVNFLLRHDQSIELGRFLSRTLHLKRRHFYEALFDFPLWLCSSQKQRKDPSPLDILPPDISAMLIRDMSQEFVSESMNALQATMTLGAVAAALLDDIVQLSNTHECGVAAKEFSGGEIGWSKENPRSLDAAGLLQTFELMRCSLRDEGAWLPRVDNIEHALLLREDANFRSFRQQLGLFHKALLKGDEQGLGQMAREARLAMRHYKENARVGTFLNWTTYIALPTAVVETLLGGPPVVGISLAALSTGLTMYAEARKQSYQWVLFGR